MGRETLTLHMNMYGFDSIVGYLLYDGEQRLGGPSSLQILCYEPKMFQSLSLRTRSQALSTSAIPSVGPYRSERCLELTHRIRNLGIKYC
jgi:hypothetical protein